MELFSLTHKVAVITGGNGGIGLGIAKGLGAAGAQVVIVGRNAEKTKAAALELQDALGRPALGIVADVAKKEDVAAMIASAAEKFGGVDILVNNAGVSVRKTPEELTLEEYQHVLDINLSAALFCSQKAYVEMKRRGGGKIINIASMMSIFGSGFSLPYAVSKGGMVQLTKSLAIAWAKDNIQVNAIMPGWIDTELTAGTRRHIPGFEQKVVDRTPAGRWGNPADVAGVAVFLASGASNFVTGASIAVDGGYSSMP